MEKNEQKALFRKNQSKKRTIQPQTNKSITSIMKTRKEKKIAIINSKNEENIPQDTKEEQKDTEQIENGDNKIQKESKVKQIRKTFKRSETISEKKGYKFNSQKFYELCDKFSLNEISANNTERFARIDNNIKENENGVESKRTLTPKKKSKEIKLVPFDSIEKESILEPRIMDSEEMQISFSDMEELQSICESFFIASIPKDEYSFAEDINNSGEAYFFKNLGQCGHNCCLKLPAYKGGLLFQYPKKEKNEQNFQI